LLGNSAACDEDKWLLMQIVNALRASVTADDRQMLLCPNCAARFIGKTTNYCPIRANLIAAKIAETPTNEKRCDCDVKGGP